MKLAKFLKVCGVFCCSLLIAGLRVNQIEAQTCGDGVCGLLELCITCSVDCGECNNPLTGEVSRTTRETTNEVMEWLPDSDGTIEEVIFFDSTGQAPSESNSETQNMTTSTTTTNNSSAPQTSNGSGTTTRLPVTSGLVQDQVLPLVSSVGGGGVSSLSEVLPETGRYEDGIIVLPDEDLEVVITSETNSGNPQGWEIIFPEGDNLVVFNMGELLREGDFGPELELVESMKFVKPVNGKMVEIILPKGTVIYSPSVGGVEPWDGTFMGPELVPSGGLCGNENKLEFGLKIGKDDRKIVFNQPIDMVFSGKGGRVAGYCVGNELVKLDNSCERNLWNSFDLEDECFRNVNGDLVVSTNHWTAFVVYKDARWRWWLIGGSVMVGVLGLVGYFWRKNEGLGDMSAIVHDLRTPLAAIRGYLSMATKGKLGPLNKETKKSLETADGSAAQLSGMVDDLLDEAKMESGEVDLDLSVFEIRKVVDQVVASLNSLADEMDLELKTSVLKKVMVRADERKVRRILTNLISNALKFTDEGSITVSSELNGGLVEIEVVDTGSGIPNQDKGKLFRKFGQGGDKKSKAKGTGLGLYVSRELARKMGGDLQLKSSVEGKGSKFVLSLPINRGDEG